ncbi:uncharacterized protein TNIN_108991 [Trichonephila inaurata madagascariensis]|uniref:RING-type domain-containing protein n=1 Tax=Trichonephila inaurata madagascariensis TaxID=2747483 RepID=A0A8X6Y6L5_9ARAC|nr:uncharacterized protein TNIN_108991 [Trichonephila inaurata madagascariensis]
MLQTKLEDLKNNVHAILKTLECAICLELLRNPVSTGCGHFFCRFCITEVLQSNYRTPCPLCKKSFTRRGIQDALQRNSIISAAKKLAETCGHLAGIDFFPLKNSQIDNRNKRTSSCAEFSNEQQIVAKKVYKTSSAKKRKSHEKDNEDGIVVGDFSVVPDVGKDDTKSYVEGQYVIPNDIVPSSNKHSCQSFEDSDSNDLPDLKELFERHSASKAAVDQPSNAEKCQKRSLSPVAPGRKMKETKISENAKNEKGTQNIDIASIISPSIISDQTSVMMQNSTNDQNVNKFTNFADKNSDVKSLKIKRKKQMNMQERRLKNRNIALRNKTNELNVVDSTENENVTMKVQESDKKTDSVVQKDKDNIKFSNEVIKENKKVNDIDLFLSPTKETNYQNGSVSTRDNCKSFKNTKRARNSKSRNKCEKNTNSVNTTEEHLILNLKEAENYKLTLSNNTIPSTVLESNISNNEECYSLNEVNLLVSNNAQDNIIEKTVEKCVHYDDIADTAISVQSVDSPKTNKSELSSRSPGWSKVKQVGKDFRVKKFSKLSVEKNSSNSNLTEVTNMDIDLIRCDVPSNETSINECSKLNKLDINSTSKDNCSGSLLGVKYKNPLVENEKQMETKDAEHFKSTSEKVEMIIKPVRHSKLLRETADYFNAEAVSANNSKTESFQANEQNKGNTNKLDEAYTDKNAFKNYSSPCDLPNKSVIIEQQNINTRMPPNGCGSPLIDSRLISTQLVDNMNTNSLHDVEISVLKENNEILNSLNGDINNQSQNKNSNLEIEYFNTENKAVEFSVKQMSNSDTSAVKETLFEANKSLNDCLNDKEIINLNSNSPSEEMFLKPNLEMLPKTDARKERLLSKFSKISKCEITATESVINEDDNVYYTEHSQQTSQRLLEYGDNIYGQQNPFLDYVAPMNVPLHCTTKLSSDVTKFSGIGSKRKSWSHQIEKFDLARFMLSRQNIEKTKVLKRTCLTLEEIHEAFDNSNMSRTTETICSLPFLSGEYRLEVCVSEETLNISVLKVLETANDAPDTVPSKSDTLLVSEKSIQTSNNNSPLKSSVTILPSSNTESEVSLPDQLTFDHNLKGKNDPFPYLNNFSDSESTEQFPSDAKVSCLNDSEIFPYFKPLSSDQSTNRNERYHSVNLDIVNVNEIKKATQSISHHTNTSNHVNDGDCNTMNEMMVNESNQNISDIAEIRDSFQSLPPTQPYLGNKNSVESCKKYSLNGTSGGKEPVTVELESNFLSNEKAVDTIKELNKKHAESEKIKSKVQLSNNEVKSVTSHASDEDVDSISLFKKTATAYSDYSKLTDCEGLSSDPDMAFATELVAPLKNIAAKMNEESNVNDCQEKQVKRNIFPEMPVLSRDKSSLSEFEELVANMSKNSSSYNSTPKPSRLSLKSKQNSKKFKRIKKYDSDEDSDSSQSSKNEPHTATRSLTKNEAQEISSESANIKNKESFESPQEQSTFSEDTNVNSSEIAMEIEDLDKKILSVVEKLKQCGRADLLKQDNLEKLNINVGKESPSKQKDEDFDISGDSEDSTDIFLQSVPPTPPDNSNSIFKPARLNQG